MTTTLTTPPVGIPPFTLGRSLFDDSDLLRNTLIAGRIGAGKNSAGLAWYNLGYAWLVLGQLDKSIFSLIDPGGDEAAAATGQPDEAIEKAVEGFSAFGQQREAVALHGFGEAVEQAPGRPARTPRARACAILAPVVLRQPSANFRSQNADHDFRSGWRDNLRLKRICGPHDLVLPQNRLQP